MCGTCECQGDGCDCGYSNECEEFSGDCEGPLGCNCALDSSSACGGWDEFEIEGLYETEYLHHRAAIAWLDEEKDLETEVVTKNLNTEADQDPEYARYIEEGWSIEGNEADEGNFDPTLTADDVEGYGDWTDPMGGTVTTRRSNVGEFWFETTFKRLKEPLKHCNCPPCRM